MFVNGLVLIVAFTIWNAVVVWGLPHLASAPAIQGFVLGLLLLVSQVLNWIRLRRSFTHGDLVGEAT